jgi:hypothetical protein
MGTSGTALFADDSACDVRDEFAEHLRSGSDPVEAAQAMIRDCQHMIDDEDEGPLFWLALAATQWKYGCLSDEVLDEAVRIIDSGLDLRRWTGSAAARRRKVLDALREQLHSPLPPFRRPRRRAHVEIRSVEVFSADGSLSAVAYELGKSPHPGAPKVQVILNLHEHGLRGGGHVVLADCEYDQISLVWLGPDKLEIAYPASVTLSAVSPTWHQSGHVVDIVYTSKDL